MIDHMGPVAAENFWLSFVKGDQVSWKNNKLSENYAVGGNLIIVGSPEQVVDEILLLHKSGCDGIQVNFFDYFPDLDFFGKRILPLLKQAGLRK